MPKKLIAGINDVATLHPEVAAEADGWDPSTISKWIYTKKMVRMSKRSQMGNDSK